MLFPIALMGDRPVKNEGRVEPGVFRRHQAREFSCLLIGEFSHRGCLGFALLNFPAHWSLEKTNDVLNAVVTGFDGCWGADIDRDVTRNLNVFRGRFF